MCLFEFTREHTLSKGIPDQHWIARQFIDLFSSYVGHGCADRKLKSDVFYVQWSRHPERLHLYGAPEDIIEGK